VVFGVPLTCLRFKACFESFDEQTILHNFALRIVLFHCFPLMFHVFWTIFLQITIPIVEVWKSILPISHSENCQILLPGDGYSTYIFCTDGSQGNLVYSGKSLTSRFKMLSQTLTVICPSRFAHGYPGIQNGILLTCMLLLVVFQSKWTGKKRCVSVSKQNWKLMRNFNW
jgi:hypothetical protein